MPSGDIPISSFGSGPVQFPEPKKPVVTQAPSSSSLDFTDLEPDAIPPPPPPQDDEAPPSPPQQPPPRTEADRRAMLLRMVSEVEPLSQPAKPIPIWKEGRTDIPPPPPLSREELQEKMKELERKISEIDSKIAEAKNQDRIARFKTTLATMDDSLYTTLKNWLARPSRIKVAWNQFMTGQLAQGVAKWWNKQISFSNLASMVGRNQRPYTHLTDKTKELIKTFVDSKLEALKPMSKNFDILRNNVKHAAYSLMDEKMLKAAQAPIESLDPEKAEKLFHELAPALEDEWKNLASKIEDKDVAKEFTEHLQLQENNEIYKAKYFESFYNFLDTYICPTAGSPQPDEQTFIQENSKFTTLRENMEIPRPKEGQLTMADALKSANDRLAAAGKPLIAHDQLLGEIKKAEERYVYRPFAEQTMRNISKWLEEGKELQNTIQTVLEKLKEAKESTTITEDEKQRAQDAFVAIASNLSQKISELNKRVKDYNKKNGQIVLDKGGLARGFSAREIYNRKYMQEKLGPTQFAEQRTQMQALGAFLQEVIDLLPKQPKTDLANE